MAFLGQTSSAFFAPFSLAETLYTKDWTLIYDGNFSNDLFNGTGTYHFPNGKFIYDGWKNGETEIMKLTTKGVSSETGKWLHNDFYGCVYENGEWYSVEIVDGIKKYAGDYGWMLN